MKKVICGLMLVLGLGYTQQQTLSLSAPPPSPVTHVSASRVGNQGNTNYYYWVVANYPIGQSIASPYAIVRNGADSLSASSYNVVNYSLVSGASNYDILRTTSPDLPSPCTCAVATAQTSGSYNDQSNSLSSYTLAPAAQATVNFTVDNVNYPQPRLYIDKVGYVWNGSTYVQMGGGGGTSTQPIIVQFQTASPGNFCNVVLGTGSCVATSTSGTGSKPGVVITDNFGQIVKWGSCFSGGSTNAIFGGLSNTNVIQDFVLTSSNNVSTFTFNVDSTGYCGVSTGGMGPTGATGPAGAQNLASATFASPPVSPTVGNVYWFTDASGPNICTGGGTSSAACRWNGSSYDPLSSATPVLPLIVVTGTTLAIGASSTNYCGLNAPNISYCSTTNVAYRAVSTGKALTVTALQVNMGQIQPATGSFVVTVYKGTGTGTNPTTFSYAATTCTLTVAAGAAAGMYQGSCSGVTFGANDAIGTQIVNNATSTTAISNITLITQ